MPVVLIVAGAALLFTAVALWQNLEAVAVDSRRRNAELRRRSSLRNPDRVERELRRYSLETERLKWRVITVVLALVGVAFVVVGVARVV